MKKSYLLFIIFAALLIISSCTRKSDINTTTSIKDTTAKTEDPFITNLFNPVAPSAADVSAIAPEEFRLRLNETFMEYTHLKHALAENDSTQAIMQTNQLKKTLANVKPETLNDVLKKKWDNLNIKIEECCKGITTTENIDKQRKKFLEITGIMTELVKEFGLRNKTVYILNCPDKKAGNWLVDSKDIANPYLGRVSADEKPCVEVKEAVRFD